MTAQMALREHRFAQVDVFTERTFGGNPLAVVFDAAGLADHEMQAIAREMNLSETTFLLPPTRPDCAARVRIFTPAREIPFAGHPTIGTSWVLASEGMLPSGATRFFLEEGIGPVEVELEGDRRRPRFLWMRHGEARFAPPLADREAVTRALGLDAQDLLPGAPLCEGSTGSAFLYVPLRDRATVDRAWLDARAALALMGDGPRLGVFVFAADPNPTAGRVYSRMFAPHTSGIPEDPATGSASGPLGAYLVTHGLVAQAPRIDIVSEQGTKMGRQSFIHIRIATEAGRIAELRVGGSVVPVLDGQLRLSASTSEDERARPPR
jgi:trans-2,3-dihydro-3-hydroxyanthranilate isomerase